MRNIKIKEIMAHYEACPGSYIVNVIEQLLCSANATGLACVVGFNGTDIVARPGDDAKAIQENWRKAQLCSCV